MKFYRMLLRKLSNIWYSFDDAIIWVTFGIGGARKIFINSFYWVDRF